MSPASPFIRPLRMWEQVCSTMNVTMSFQLEGCDLTEGLLRTAWAACQREYPFLRCAIVHGQKPYPEEQLFFQELATPVSSFRPPCFRRAPCSGHNFRLVPTALSEQQAAS